MSSMAQTVPDAPILISEENSTRAFAVDPNRWRGSLKVRTVEAVKPGGSVILFLTNVKNLLSGEGANAFRLYAEDGSRKRYIFRVESFEPVRGMDWVYAVRINLDPNIEDVGDVLVRITWRGMATNRVRLGVGHTGGGLPNDEGAVPTPMPLSPPVTQDPEIVYPSSDIRRFMAQATFGPTPQLEEYIRRRGFTLWLNEQFTMPLPASATAPSCGDTTGCTLKADEYPNLPLMPTNIATACTGDCRRNNYSQYPMQRWFFTNALYGQDQLRRRVAWAMLQILVVSGNDLQQPSWVLHYQKILDKNAFGNYRTMLRDITLSPAMGNYLDMFLSTRFSPNENFAREINQLFAVGLFELNLDGTLKLDGNNQPIPTYTQATIDNFTKVFTGWQTCNTAVSCPNVPPAGTVNYIDPMLLNQSLHDTTAKTLYNYPGAPFPTIAAGQNGNVEIEQALDNIYNHPNVAPFVSKNLIQHLVTSDPSPAYVQRVATIFNAYRTDANQLRYVISAILLDPEARGAIKNAEDYGLLREPVLLATNVMRNFGVKSAASAACDLVTPSTCSDGSINGFAAAMGQSVYMSPTVFNYYPPDYIVPNTNPSVLGPEFAILTTSTAFQRANVMNTFVMSTGQAASTSPNTNFPFGTALLMTELQNAATADATGNQLMDLLNNRMMHGTMSAQMRSTILTAVTAVASSNPLLRARTALYLVTTSSQFQIQK